MPKSTPFDAAIALATCRRWRRLHHATTRGRLELRRGWTLSRSDLPRVLLCASGRRRLSLLSASGQQELELRADEALHVAPGCWLGSEPGGSCVTIGVIFATGALRCLSRTARPGHPTLRFARSVPGPLRELPLLSALLGHCAERPAADAYARSLLGTLAEFTFELLRTGDAERSPGRMQWEAASQFIEEHCAEPIGRDHVAKALGVHPNHLSRLFRREGRSTFVQHLRRIRLERVRSLLQESDAPLAGIARASGFATAAYLISCYRDAFGSTPGRDRQP